MARYYNRPASSKRRYVLKGSCDELILSYPQFFRNGFLNGSIVFLLQSFAVALDRLRFAKNNTPIFHMETIFLSLLHLLTLIVTGSAVWEVSNSSVL